MKKLLCASMMLFATSAFANDVTQTSAPDPQVSPEIALASQALLQGVSLERVTPVGGKNKVVVFRISDDTVCKVKVRYQKLKPQASVQDEKILIDGPTVCSFEKKGNPTKKVKN